MDYDFKNWTILIPDSKSKNHQTNLINIHSSFRKYFEVIDWTKYPKDHYVFHSGGQPSKEQQTNRDYYTDKFSKVRQHFGFSSHHTLYGLKHTMMCHLAEQGMELRKLMTYGRFNSVDALQQYLKHYLNRPLEDLSNTIDKLLG